MAVKKSQLYSALWESCNALRGSMDASQYKDYVLIVLFVKYLSDKAGQPGFRLKVPEGCHFKDFVALKQNDKIGELINTPLFLRFGKGRDSFCKSLHLFLHFVESFHLGRI